LCTSLVIVLVCMLGFSTEVQQAKAQVTFYIRADGSIDPPTAPISTFDSLTYTFTGNIFNPIVIERDNITIDGSGHILQGPGPGPYYAMNLTERYNVTVKKTIIENFGMGIYVVDSSKITILQNIVRNNAATGVYIYRSSNCNVIDNKLINDGRGLGVYLFSGYNTISGNLVKDNSERGMYLNARSNLYYGNNFINNTVHVLYTTIYSEDFWDNGVEGNYWDNYTGHDLDSDGIGDSSHRIDVNNRDFHPLMGMFSGFQATQEHRIETVSNSTLSDFKFNSTALSYNVTGAHATAGFCRVKIPAALMNITYRVFVNSTEILPPPEPLPCSTSTHNYLYFTYNHSTQEVIIIPEFSSLIIISLFMIVSILVITIHKVTKRSTQHFEKTTIHTKCLTNAGKCACALFQDQTK